MPFDGLVTKKVCEEYNEKLINGKIDKIIQPTKNDVILFIRNNRINYKLLLCINAQNARTHLTNISNILNPSKPFNFCMVLRKYLIGSRIISISQIGNDRILTFTLETNNELGDKEIKKLIIEIMGKYSNIILTSAKGIIIDSIKHVDFEMSSIREVMPGRQYILPLSNGKTNPFDVSEKEFNNMISKKHSLSDNFEGICSSLNNIDSLYTYSNFINFINKIPAPIVYFENNNIKDFYYTNINADSPIKEYTYISEAIDSFYTQKINIQKINTKKNLLLSLVNSNIIKVQKKLNIAKSKILTTKEMDSLKKKGELLQANLYKIKPFANEIIVEDYYKNLTPLKIELNVNLTPSQNVQKIFKKYTKLKNTLIACTNQQNILQKELEYLESLVFEINFQSSLENLIEIEEELEKEGFLKKQKSKKITIKSSHLHFVYNNFNIFVGKNNIQNDNLTFNIAHKKDIWFHVKNAPGSHTILQTKPEIETPNEILEFAASLAAFYSKLSNSPKVEIDYTQVKNLKKIPGAKPGMVIYENYKTIYIKPNDGQTFLHQ